MCRTTVVRERLVFWTHIPQDEPVVGVQAPPDLPPTPTGGGGGTTGSGPGGVLPPPTTSGPRAGNPFDGPGNSADKNQVTDWIGMAVASVLIACLELFC